MNADRDKSEQPVDLLAALQRSIDSAKAFRRDSEAVSQRLADAGTAPSAPEPSQAATEAHGNERVAELLAENARLTHLLGSHADGHRCTCTMTDPGVYFGSNMHPPEWEQDPWCPTHPNVDHIRDDLLALADNWESKADDGEENGHTAAARAVRADAAELRAALPGPTEPEGHPCGHAERVYGCGGCDPGAVDYVRDDGDTAWRKATEDGA